MCHYILVIHIKVEKHKCLCECVSYLCQNGIHTLAETVVAPDRSMDTCHILITKDLCFLFYMYKEAVCFHNFSLCSFKTIN